ncbi:MAG: glutaredoxin family protein [Methanomicrobiales archaeon]|nr:glutaredoxin family protein [Methanomicrobiales archaeon]
MNIKAPVKVYSLESCPNCDELKKFLAGEGVDFEDADMASAAPLAELRIHGVFVREAPVLRVGEVFLVSKDLFPGGKLDISRLRKVLSGEVL